ncbi:hypothetical protein NO136_19405, partial [Clostridioides difficile]|nr:hypothetical protein [Clostridioides difficile]
LIVEGVHNILGYDSKPVGLAAIAIGALLAIYGHDAMHRAFKWSLYATLPVYVIVTVLAMTLGVVLGVVTAVLRLSSNPVLGAIAQGYIWLFRGTPVILQL